jgi:hypothetical protein
MSRIEFLGDCPQRKTLRNIGGVLAPSEGITQLLKAINRIGHTVPEAEGKDAVAQDTKEQNFELSRS